jgi:phage shock protein A
VLHTRIPAVLEAELKSTAAALRVPVSNLVRAILEDAVAIADRASEKVEDRLARAARTVHDERDRLRARVVSDPLRDVVAYQNVTMAVDGRCAKCRAELGAGDDAALAVLSRPGPTQFVCADCLPKR